MTTEIWGHYMKMRLHCSSDRVPTAAMVAAAMDKDQWWRCFITPVGVMQPQALRFIEPVCRAGQ